ncbi:MAG: alginate lyase family protein [Candidatus Eisenbacteria bacterium]
MNGTRDPMWRVRRLLAMSPAEVGLRVARGIAHRAQRSRTPVHQSELVSPESVLSQRVAAEEVVAWLERELAEDRGRLLPGARDGSGIDAALRAPGVRHEELMDAAEAVLEGKVRAFGWTDIDIGRSPDWLRDPDTGGAWPLTFWTDVDFRGTDGLGDPRYVWEVNRHHHLVTLGRAYVLSGEPRFAERIWRDIVSWVEANPPLFGINWSSPLEIAIRLMSWAMALDLVGSNGAKGFDAATVATSVALQTEHLSDNLSVYASSRNNHLIGEAAGLLVAGAKFKFLRRAGRFSRRGKDVLERELNAQVSADGVTREQALQYQVLVIEFALLGMAAAAALGTSLAPDSVEIVGKMSRFLGSVSGMGGVPPSVGDEDGGRAYELSDRPGRQAAMAAAVGALAAGTTPPASCVAADFEPALWLFGTESTADLARKRGEEHCSGCDRAYSCYFADGGYFVPAGDAQHGVIDCGPLGYLSIAAHGHADCLSLAVSHLGRWVLVDPGTYCYHRDALWRDHFRSTPAHNTVSVDGLSQSTMLGPFMWGRKARARQLVWASTPRFDYFEGAHDGFASRDGVLHRRSVFFGKRGYWLVIDHLEGRGRHQVDATFQLAEGYYRRQAGGLVFVADDGQAVEFRTWLPDGVAADVVEGAETPPCGWVSSGFGRKVAAPAVVETGVVELPATLITTIVPFDGESVLNVSCATGGWNGGAVFDIEFPEGRDRVLLGAPRSQSSNERFSGTVGFVSDREGGRETTGLGVTEWTEEGSSVAHEPVADLLSDP